MNVVFLGGGSFAIPLMESILKSHHALVGVVARPDSEAGRGRRAAPCPSSNWASRHAVPLLKPERVSDPQFESSFRALGAEIAMVADFGEILKPFVLSWVEKGFFGVHPSLLPRWRGAAPIPWAILAGDSETGVVIFRMSSGVDSGGIAARRRVPIRSRETTPRLEGRLARIGANLTIDFLAGIDAGRLSLEQQPPNDHATARRLRMEDGRLRWNDDADALDRRVRAMLPWPCGWFEVHGLKIKVLEAISAESSIGEPGTVQGLQTSGKGLEGIGISCGFGSLLLQVVQSPGRRPLAARDWLNGFRLKTGEVLI